MPNNNTIHSKIIRLFNDEANPKEKREVGDWLNQSADNKKLYLDLQEVWLASGVSKNSDKYQMEQALSHFKQRIRTGSKQVRIGRVAEILKYAAILVLLLSLPVIYYLGKNGSQLSDSYTTISCAFGDKSTIILPDGSVAFLNSGSKITFNNDFQHQYRMVSLEGEAYFAVKENKDIPFHVKAAEIEIEVLGTEFNLKAYPDENTISTTLAEGSIQIKSTSQQTVMKPNQKAVFNRVDREIKVFTLNDISPETEWKEGRLVFRNESLAELELKLERWFDVDILFADEQVKKRKFTGTVERESILEAISYFNYSEYVGYEINNNEITFYSK